MVKVFKYKLPSEGSAVIKMPKYSLIMNVQAQDGFPCIWALVNPDAKEFVTRKFVSYGTGQPIEGDELKKNALSYIGTTQFLDGKFVLHTFEEIEDE